MSKPRAFPGSLWLLFILCILAIQAISASEPIGTLTNSGDSARIIGFEPTWEFSNAPVIVNDSTIDSAIKDYSTFVLDCWEQGCKPCQLIDPTIDEMALDFRGKITFGKLRIDQNQKTRIKYHIYHYPMLLIFKNGSLVYKHLGNYPKATLEEIILTKLGIN